MSSSQATSQTQGPSSSNGTSPSSSQSFSDPPPGSSTNHASPSPTAAPSPSPPTSTTNAPPTTSTPPPTTTTSHTTTTTTTAEAQTTTSSNPTTNTSIPPTTSTSMVTSSIPTTFVSTNSAGSTVIVTTAVVSVFPTIGANNGSGNSSSNSHTAAIIGGAVGGGVAGVFLLALFIYCIRRRGRKDEFDGNFDPDRVVGHTGGGGTLPQVDLADEVTPFPQSYTDHDAGSMRQRQYGDSTYLPVAPSIGSSGVPARTGTPSEMYYPPGGSSQEGTIPPHGYGRPGVSVGPSPGAYQAPVNVPMYGTGPNDWHTPVPMASPPPSTVGSLATTSGRHTKEREAMGRGLALATQPEGGEREVVVHQDAGRAPSEENPPPREIPPTYDSIRHD